MIKKCMAVLIALVTLLSSFAQVLAANNYGYDIEAAKSAGTYYDELPGYRAGYMYSDSSPERFSSLTGQVPPGTPSSISVNAMSLPFNYRLWDDKHIVVYGDYASMMDNDFKEGTQNSTGVPYYSKNGTAGEYRFHGFTKEGNKFTNIDFPDDGDTVTNFDVLNNAAWIFQPWGSDYVKNAFSWDMSLKESDYNIAAQSDAETAAWINNGVTGLQVRNGVYDTGESTYDNRLFNYMNVLSAPGANYMGEGRMWQLLNNSIWYQTFPINKVIKKPTPNSVIVRVYDENGLLAASSVAGEQLQTELKLKKGEKEVKATVKLEGVLEDDAYYNNKYLKVTRYTRDDVGGWTVNMTEGAKGGLTSSGLYVPQGNKVTAEYPVTFTRAEVLANKVRVFTGTSRAEYVDGKWSATAQASATATIKVEGKGIQSIFDITQQIDLAQSIDFSNSRINYRDNSQGTIERYEYKIESLDFVNEGSFTVNAPHVDDEDINSKLFAFMNTYVKNADGKTFKFMVTQTVFSADESDTMTRDVTVTIAKQDSGNPIPPPVIVAPKLTLPSPVFDVVRYKPADNTDLSKVSSRKVYVDGVQVDDVLFFSGEYVFGDGNHGIREVTLKYTSIDGSESFQTAWVEVINTKPRAQYLLDGTYKQNRKLTADNTSESANDMRVISQFPMTFSWNYRAVSGDESSLRCRNSECSGLHQSFMYKMPGVYELELRSSLMVVDGDRRIQRDSDPYTVRFIVYPDYKPAVEIGLNYSAMARGEKIGAYLYNAVSTDGDTVASNAIELWYDSDNDGTYDQKLNTWDGTGGFPEYRPSSLGHYKFVNTVTEEFGQETLDEFITEADRATLTKEREFWVDNFVPMTDIYVDIPIVRPEVDVYFMLDANMNDSKRGYVISNRMNINNALRTENILPKVETWDMKTYVYSQGASTSINTGSSYPSGSTYYSSGGYSGTLYLDSVSDNGWNEDHGHYVTKTESKTATGTASGYCTAYYVYNGSSWELFSVDETNIPSISYSDGEGFSGELYKTGYSYDGSSGSPPSNPRKGDSYSQTDYYTGYYSGTVTRTIQVWEPHWVWISNYTGYYSGTIYMSARQPYTNPFRPTSKKYVVYITDNTISQLGDLQTVMGKSDAQLILIGQDAAAAQISSSKFIRNTGTIDSVVNQALNYICENTPAIEKYYVLINQAFSIKTSNFDEENDPIMEQSFQYVQDQDYFDNAQGLESFAVDSYSEASGWTARKADKFTKPGEYTIHRRIKDQPTADPNFAAYSYYSGERQLRIYAHRKPIALATLDWDYDPATSTYKTTWVDKSYDLDHQYSREDKGVVERKIMYRRNGGEWYYRIPDNLTAGTYELQYYVKDPEGVWSDPFTLNFTLNPTPPMQFTANLRTLDSYFSLGGIPVTEYLEVYNAWTRFPYNVRLEMALYNGSTRVSPLNTVNYSAATGSKTGHDIYWNNIAYQIPATLPDGNYTFRISAVGDYSQTSTLSFPVTVSTPVNLIPNMPGKLVARKTFDITANTSKYVATTMLTLYKRTPYEVTMSMDGTQNGRLKDWIKAYAVRTGIPDGIYMAEFKSTTTNNNTEIKDVPFEHTNNRPPTVTANRYPATTVYEGDNVSINIFSDDPDGDLLTVTLETQYNSGGWTTLNTWYDVSPGSMATHVINGVQTGVYDIRITVSDPMGEVVSAQFSFTASVLSIDGYVMHTDLWNAHRQEYNLSKGSDPESPRTYNVFFPGERLMLLAYTTAIDPDREAEDGLHAEYVHTRVKYGSTGGYLNYEGNFTWTGSLWDETMEYWGSQAVTIVFHVRYSNGTEKETEVNILIDDDPYWRQHRLF